MEPANKELEPTKGAMPVDAAPFAAQFRRWADISPRRADDKEGDSYV